MQNQLLKSDYHLTVEEQNSILHLQQSVLELVTGNSSDDEILRHVCVLAENLLPDAVASIMALQPAGHLDIICAPSVPPEGVSALSGLIPSERGGSCGNAVYNNEPTYIVDTGPDPRCDDIRDTLEEFNLCACWSHPIRDSESEPVGSFALSSFSVREPQPFHQKLLAICSYLTGITLQRQRQNEKLELLAYTDPLTGLANRVSLYEKIARAIKQSTEEQSSFALLFLDLDRFKNLNDTFGHSVGDDVLVMIANRLKEDYVNKSDVLARVGGDEFVLLIQDDVSAQSIEARAKYLLSKIKEPILYHSHRFLIDGSVGISVFPKDGTTAEQLIKHADTAMYQAKKFLTNKISHYQAHLSEKAEQAFTIENELHHALEKEEFELYFQPQMDTTGLQVSGMEALIRWKPEHREMVSPADFIPVAEETALIVPIGHWVVVETLRVAQPIIKHSNNTISISINLSPVQLSDDNLDHLLNLIDSSPIPNHLIELEITETVLVQEADSLKEQLEKLKRLGIRLAIDDFGSGYSSLAYLKRFNVDTLKIDRSLIKDIADDDNALAIVKAVIVMGNSLGLRLIAEGIETKQQADILKNLDCDGFQGFYFARPAPMRDLLQQGLLTV